MAAGVDLKKFSELHFLQGLHIDGLVRILSPYSTYFAAQGLDLATLRNDDPSARRLHTVFTRADEDTPPALLDVLYMIGDLADDIGQDRLLLAATQAGLDMTWATDHMTAGDFAIGMFLRHPNTVRSCAARVARKIKNFAEYRAKDDTDLDLDHAIKNAPALEKVLAAWFDLKKRSPVCKVHPFQDGEEIRFSITHGQLYRTDGSISKTNTMQRVAFRPQQHDAVIFDNRTHTLKINARNIGERGLYRTAFGQILFGDPNHFPDGAIYTLAPLRVSPLTFKPVVGIRDNGVVLTEVWIEYATLDQRVETFYSKDLAVSIAQDGRPNLQAGTLTRACFMIRYSSGGRARKLEIRVPNVAIFDHERDGEVTEKFLEANGFVVKAGGDDVGDRDEPDGQDLGGN